MKATIALVAAMVLAVAVVQPAAAYTVIHDVGDVGPYFLADSVSTPAARCVYEYPANSDEANLTKLRVWPPKMWAHSQSQRVGWRFSVVMHDPGFGDDGTILYRSPIQKDRATDQVRANSFRPQKWTPDVSWGKFSVLIDMYWYVPGTRSQIDGYVRVEPEFQRTLFVGYNGVSRFPCTYSVRGGG